MKGTADTLDSDSGYWYSVDGYVLACTDDEYDDVVTVERLARPFPPEGAWIEITEVADGFELDENRTLNFGYVTASDEVKTPFAYWVKDEIKEWREIEWRNIND